MPLLVSVDLRLPHERQAGSHTSFQMRWGSYLSIWVVLAIFLFGGPDPHRNTEAVHLSRKVFPPAAPATSSPAASSSALLAEAHETAPSSIRRLARLAKARPKLALLLLVDTLIGPKEETETETQEKANVSWAPTVEELRSVYGERQRWWGDFSPAETRALYHALLPTRCVCVCVRLIAWCPGGCPSI